MNNEMKLGCVLFTYAVAAVSGALGGCSAAAVSKVFGKKSVTWSLAAAYAFIGFMLSILMMTLSRVLWGANLLENPYFIEYAFLSGLAGTLLLVFHNIAARIVLEKFGIKITLDIGEKDDNARNRRQKSGSDVPEGRTQDDNSNSDIR